MCLNNLAQENLNSLMGTNWEMDQIGYLNPAADDFEFTGGFFPVLIKL